MGWRETARLIGLRVPSWKAHALTYLERRGFRFCIDFGTDNAVELARQDWRNRRRNRKATR